MVIMGSMIGSGIFIVSAEMAGQVVYPGLLLLAWAITGVITVLAALSYGELAAAMPKAGGQYVYLREAYNPLTGFLYGWTLFGVIQTGTIAAVGVAFAKFTGVFLPFISDANVVLDMGIVQVSTQKLLAIAAIVLLTVYNFRDVKAGAWLQNIFTFAKIIALLGLVVVGLYFGVNAPEVATSTGRTSHFTPLFPSTYSWSALAVFGAALTGSLFSADAWNNITYTASEVENPKRNLPAALLIGTVSVIIIYFFANVAYLQVMDMQTIANAENGRVGTLMMEIILGNKGKYVMAALIMISTFGCLNGIIFTAARVYYAMALDGVFFGSAGKLNKNQVPQNALIMQCIWSCLLAFSGTYGDLLNYIMFAVMLFYILTVGGIFILRRTQPQLHRPYKVIFYPVLPIVYIVLAAAVCVFMLWVNPLPSLLGLGIILVGIPFYYLFKSRRQSS
jgi:APA family basic amino acid/polyamine antiporter